MPEQKQMLDERINSWIDGAGEKQVDDMVILVVKT